MENKPPRVQNFNIVVLLLAVSLDNRLTVGHFWGVLSPDLDDNLTEVVPEVFPAFWTSPKTFFSCNKMSYIRVL